MCVRERERERESREREKERERERESVCVREEIRGAVGKEVMEAVCVCVCWIIT